MVSVSGRVLAMLWPIFMLNALNPKNTSKTAAIQRFRTRYFKI